MTSVDKTFPLLPPRIEGQVVSMELASTEFFDQLRKLSVEQLKTIQCSPIYKPIVTAMIDMRSLMGS